MRGLFVCYFGKPLLMQPVGSATITAAMAITVIGSADAQSSVTLYGIVSTDITYISNVSNAGGSSVWRYTAAIGARVKFGHAAVNAALRVRTRRRSPVRR